MSRKTLASKSLNIAFVQLIVQHEQHNQNTNIIKRKKRRCLVDRFHLVVQT